MISWCCGTGASYFCRLDPLGRDIRRKQQATDRSCHVTCISVFKQQVSVRQHFVTAAVQAAPGTMSSVDITIDATWFIAMFVRETRMLAPPGVWRGLILACCRHRVVETPTGSLSPSQGALHSPPLWYRSAFYCLCIVYLFPCRAGVRGHNRQSHRYKYDDTREHRFANTNNDHGSLVSPPPPCRFLSRLDESASNR